MKSYLLTALSTAVVLSAAQASDKMKTEDKEKCYGIAKAGKNDCADATGLHTCSGKATKDNEKSEWMYVKKGECKDKGGSTGAPAA